MSKLIETKKITQDSLDYIERHTPFELEHKHRNGDFLYLLGIAFNIVFYSGDALENGQSIEVTYWSELYDLEINLNWKEQTVETATPLRDWNF